jgi:hypothetical protein
MGWTFPNLRVITWVTLAYRLGREEKVTKWESARAHVPIRWGNHCGIRGEVKGVRVRVRKKRTSVKVGQAMKASPRL